MAESEPGPYEGWEVPVRPTAIAGLLVPVVLALGVLGCGAIYAATLGPRLRYSVTVQPAPGLETDIHAGVADPELPSPTTVADPALARAKAEIAAEGLAGWPGQAQ